MDDTLQTCIDTIFTCDSICNNINSCRCEVGTSAMVDAPTTHNTGAYVVGVLGIVAALCVGYLLWKMIACLKKEMENLRTRLTKCNEQLTPLQDKVTSLSAIVADLSEKANVVAVKNVERHSVTSKDNHSLVSNPKSKAPVLTVRYATLQAPDENGVLRFAERSMVEAPSAEKMFVLELDLDKGTGTYGINSRAMSLILGDLQMFRDYVKPFSFSGNASSATVKDKKKGRITRRGPYWVVDEQLEIIIN